MAFTIEQLEALLHLLEEQPESRARLRLLLLPDGLDTLPARFDRLTEIVERLAEAQARTEARLEQLAAAQGRTEARLEQLAAAQARTEARLEQLAEAQAQTAEQLRQLVSWQHGESGRRAGEHHERRIARRAPVIFAGGQGGTPDQPAVRDRLAAGERSLAAVDLLTNAEADPSLADLIWWKDDHFVVVEASLQVDSRDVDRAARRAATLQQATGAEAVGMVVGEGWDEPDTRFLAEARGVVWWVGGDLSEGFVAFRKL